MKIAVYAISKNEEKFVKRFCDSAKDADLILIADTGSTDNTVAEAKLYGAAVYDITISPWRFDKARDAALALIPRDVDVCISLDLDEELQPGWREEIERVWKEDTTRLSYMYDWGNGVVYRYEKIHARHGYSWHHPCHEYPKADARIKEVYAQTDKLLVVHKPDPTKSRGQYLELLKMSVEEDPRCPRNAFYYARELTFYQKWQEAKEALLRYLDMPEATWANERAYAMRLLGDCTKDLAWYRKACAEDPTVRDTWCALAKAASEAGLWEECFGAASNALRITNRSYLYTEDEACWKERPHDLLALAAHYLGFKETAIKHGQIAVDFDPNNTRLTTNLKFYKE